MAVPDMPSRFEVQVHHTTPQPPVKPLGSAMPPNPVIIPKVITERPDYLRIRVDPPRYGRPMSYRTPLAKLMAKHNIYKYHLTKPLGMSERNLTEILAGRRRLPMNCIPILARILKCSHDDLLPMTVLVRNR